MMILYKTYNVFDIRSHLWAVCWAQVERSKKLLTATNDINHSDR